MIYSGDNAINYLASEVPKKDRGESSHWRKYHSNFQFTGEGFEGLKGFGGNTKPYRGVRKLTHRLLQRRFRRMGNDYPKFAEIDSLAQDIAAKQRRAYDLDMLRQSLTLAFLDKNINKNVLSENTTACVIGDGYATMTALLLASGNVNRVALVNLTKTLLVDLWYLKLWMGEKKFQSNVDLITDEAGANEANEKFRKSNTKHGMVVAIQADHHELIKHFPVELAINIVSMQEMMPESVSEYFVDMRNIADKNDLVFYCCYREEKKLPDGTLVKFSEYPWNDEDNILVDELCPWHQQYYTLKPPFYFPYDGPIQHRLVIF